MRPVQQELQIRTGDALNTIKLIRMNFTLAQILGKLKKDPCRCKQMIGPQLRSSDNNRSLFELKRNELTEC